MRETIFSKNFDKFSKKRFPPICDPFHERMGSIVLIFWCRKKTRYQKWIKLAGGKYLNNYDQILLYEIVRKTTLAWDTKGENISSSHGWFPTSLRGDLSHFVFSESAFFDVRMRSLYLVSHAETIFSNLSSYSEKKFPAFLERMGSIFWILFFVSCKKEKDLTKHAGHWKLFDIIYFIYGHFEFFWIC